MEKLKKHGKGIVLVHDFPHARAEGAMDLLNDLKAGGYKIVFMKPKFSVTTIASYDEAILKQLKGPMTDTRPTSAADFTYQEYIKAPDVWKRGFVFGISQYMSAVAQPDEEAPYPVRTAFQRCLGS